MPLTPSTGWVATPVRGVAINWNGGSPCIGIVGRHDPVRSVSAGVEEDQARTSALIQRFKYVIEQECAGQMRQVGYLSVDGDEIVFATHLQPVARIVEQRNVGSCVKLRLEFRKGIAHTLEVEVQARHDIEAEAAEHGRYCSRVIGWVDKRASIRIATIAHNEGNARLGRAFRQLPGIDRHGANGAYPKTLGCLRQSSQETGLSGIA